MNYNTTILNNETLPLHLAMAEVKLPTGYAEKLLETRDDQSESKIAELRLLYGDIFIIMYKSGSQFTGYYSPIELAAIPPFSFKLSTVTYGSIASSIVPIFPTNWPADAPLLISIVEDCKSIEERHVYIASHYPLLSYLENKLISGDEAGLNVANAIVKMIKDQHLKNMKVDRLDNIPIAEQYKNVPLERAKREEAEEHKQTRELIAEYFGGDYDEAPVPQELKDKILGLFNDYLARQGRSKNIPPPIQTNVIELIAYETIMRTEISPSIIDLINHPKLIPYSHQVLDTYLENKVTTPQVIVKDDPGTKQSFNVITSELPRNYIHMLSLETHRLLKIETPIDEKSTVIIPYEIASKLYISAYDPRSALIEYTGGVLDSLDMSKTYLTGSAMAFALVSREILEMRRFVLEYTDRYLNHYYPNFYLSATRFSVNPITHLYKDGTFDTIHVSKYGKTTVLDEGKIKPGADIDLMVDASVSKEEFDAIANKHYIVFKSKWPKCVMELIPRDKGYTYKITSNYVDIYKGFREVEIYRGTINTIVSHHVPPVRAWYRDGKIMMEASCLLCQMDGGRYTDYHYFAGRKSSPADVISKYRSRGYYPILPRYINALAKIAEELQKLFTPDDKAIYIQYNNGELEAVTRFLPQKLRDEEREKLRDEERKKVKSELPSMPFVPLPPVRLEAIPPPLPSFEPLPPVRPSALPPLAPFPPPFPVAIFQFAPPPLPALTGVPQLSPAP